jgi:hypothetical protein
MTLAARMTPGRSAAERSSPGHGGLRRPGRDPGAAVRSWRGRAILRAAVSTALIAVAFGLALPRVVFYRVRAPGLLAIAKYGQIKDR